MKISQRVNENFARVNENFARVNENFARVNENFARVNENFARVNENFARVNENFARVNENSVPNFVSSDNMHLSFFYAKHISNREFNGELQAFWLCVFSSQKPITSE